MMLLLQPDDVKKCQTLEMPSSPPKYHASMPVPTSVLIQVLFGWSAAAVLSLLEDAGSCLSAVVVEGWCSLSEGSSLMNGNSSTGVDNVGVEGDNVSVKWCLAPREPTFKSNASTHAGSMPSNSCTVSLDGLVCCSWRGAADVLDLVSFKVSMMEATVVDGGVVSLTCSATGFTMVVLTASLNGCGLLLVLPPVKCSLDSLIGFLLPRWATFISNAFIHSLSASTVSWRGAAGSSDLSTTLRMLCNVGVVLPTILAVWWLNNWMIISFFVPDIFKWFSLANWMRSFFFMRRRPALVHSS